MKKTKLAWNLETIKNPQTRPKQIVTIGGDFQMPSGMNSTVYKFTNLENDKWYIGYHKETDRAYFSSTTNEEFKLVLANLNSKLKFEILEWGSVEECKHMEYELLNKYDAKNNPMSYNLHNGHPGKPKLKINSVKELVNDIDILRKRKDIPLKELSKETHRKEAKTAEVLSLIDNLQTRDLQIDGKNLQYVMDRIENQIGTYDLPVFLEDVQHDGKYYEFLLISGNHTITAHIKLGKHYPKTPLEYIVIPKEIHQRFSDMEIRMISNDLNSNYNGGKSFSKGDAVKECLGHYNNGYSWNTSEMHRRFMNLGLTKNQVAGVVNEVLDKIEKKRQKEAGMVVMNYDSKHKDILEYEIKHRQSDDTFVYSTASTTPNLNRIFTSFISEQKKRFEKYEKLQTKILALVHHSSEHTKKQFKTIKKSILAVQDINTSTDSLLTDFKKKISKKIFHPEITFVELPMYRKDIDVKKLEKSI